MLRDYSGKNKVEGLELWEKRRGIRDEGHKVEEVGMRSDGSGIRSDLSNWRFGIREGRNFALKVQY